ncbi:MULTISPECIES: hypothetical protein [unclassified Streptomyces]|uniref:hypothetical protein n=1 Tax=Streptomyces sp. NPDC127532 TaxID=3345399 RepID=UPI00363907E3
MGRWLTTQRQDRNRPGQGQRERLAQLGATPAPRPAVPAPKTCGRGRERRRGGAFERGLAALAQYKLREGHERPVPSKHEQQVQADRQEHVVKHGVFISNTKSRRHRLTPEQHQAPAELGVEWA